MGCTQACPEQAGSNEVSMLWMSCSLIFQTDMVCQKWLSFGNHKYFHWKWMKVHLYSSGRIGRWLRWSGRHCWQYSFQLMNHAVQVRWGSKNYLQKRSALSPFLWWSSIVSPCQFNTLTRLPCCQCKVASKSRFQPEYNQDSKYLE